MLTFEDSQIFIKGKAQHIRQEQSNGNKSTMINKKARIYDFLSECDREDIVLMLYSGIFGEQLLQDISDYFEDIKECDPIFLEYFKDHYCK